MIIDCISDLHGYYPELPGGDLLIVAGDLTARDLENEIALFDYWLHDQNYSAKIVIAGNHDNVLKEKRLKLEFGTYLEDSGTEFQGLKIWGSPWTNWFKGVHPKCKAFMASEDKIGKKFALIPQDTDILVTHSPPYGILDKTDRDQHVGSIYLKSQLIHIVKPKLHVFGHIHECGGKKIDLVTTVCVNASHVNELYQPVNAPVRVFL